MGCWNNATPKQKAIWKTSAYRREPKEIKRLDQKPKIDYDTYTVNFPYQNQKEIIHIQ